MRAGASLSTSRFHYSERQLCPQLCHTLRDLVSWENPENTTRIEPIVLVCIATVGHAVKAANAHVVKGASSISMPRPKVLPEHRQRASHACPPCRASKKKCDGHLPCSHCIQRNAQSLCTFNKKNGHVYGNRRQPSLRAGNGSLEPQNELHAASIADINDKIVSPDPVSEISASCKSNTEPTARMLQNSDGERG